MWLILCESPGQDYLTIKGFKLLTDLQVLFSFLANLNRLRKDGAVRQETT